IDLEELPPHLLMGSRQTLETELRTRWRILLGKDQLPAGNEFQEKANWREGEEIVAARYFSPKTSDVSGLSGQLSWREVIRLNPPPNSAAAKDGLRAMYFLSVLYVNDLEKDPFTNRAINIQVILARDPVAKPKDDPVCWLVFDPAREFALDYATTT